MSVSSLLKDQALQVKIILWTGAGCTAYSMVFSIWDYFDDEVATAHRGALAVNRGAGAFAIEDQPQHLPACPFLSSFKFQVAFA
jgi:hypothetical protein